MAPGNHRNAQERNDTSARSFLGQRPARNGEPPLQDQSFASPAAAIKRHRAGRNSPAARTKRYGLNCSPLFFDRRRPFRSVDKLPLLECSRRQLRDQGRGTERH